MQFNPHCPICSNIMQELPAEKNQRNFSHFCDQHPNQVKVFAGSGLRGIVMEEYWTFYLPKVLTSPISAPEAST